MDLIRRRLMLGAGGALGGAALAPAALATTRGEVALLATYVARTAYHQAQEAAATLHAGDRVVLRREPGNDYDPRAIEVRTRSGAKLGYLPRVDNHAPASLIDAGFEVTGAHPRWSADRRQPDIRLEVLLRV